MRILFVAMGESVHTARWLRQLSDRGWDLHLFPSWDDTLHPELPPLTYHPKLGAKSRPADSSLRASHRHWLLPKTIWRKLRRSCPRWFSESQRLARVIDKLQPDLVHSIELQHAGYLTYRAREHLVNRARKFPQWLVTNWGSDIYFFRHLADHATRIRQVLKTCDHYDCESIRDQTLAREMGFQGICHPVTPNAGGFHLDSLRMLRQPGRTSKRRVILIKGYQNWAGRAMIALHAVELASDALQGYQVRVYSAADDVALVAEHLQGRTGLPVQVVPKVPHDEMMAEHGAARISIGISASDGVSTSFLEAMVMGAYPIQSDTATADEWITNGKTGSIVDPHNPQVIADAIRHAAINDQLVDQAALINDKIVTERLDYRFVKSQAISMYETILRTSKDNTGLS